MDPTYIKGGIFVFRTLGEQYKHSLPMIAYLGQTLCWTVVGAYYGIKDTRGVDNYLMKGPLFVGSTLIYTMIGLSGAGVVSLAIDSIHCLQNKHQNKHQKKPT